MVHDVKCPRAMHKQRMYAQEVFDTCKLCDEEVQEISDMIKGIKRKKSK